MTAVDARNARALEPPDHAAVLTGGVGPVPLERQGRRWIFGSFALCPCHLPLTLGALATVFGGTAAGAVLRDHAVLAGAVISVAWVAGTWRGFRLVRLARHGACPMPALAAGPAVSHDRSFGPADQAGDASRSQLSP